MTHVFKDHVTIVKIYMAKFNVTIFNKAQNNEGFYK